MTWAGTSHWPRQALLGRGEVRHRRLRPAPHQFSYRSYFLMLPMRSLRSEACPALHRNAGGLNWLSFHDADHGEGGADSLAWLDALLVAEGVADADGEVWLHCFPRVLGFAFKPVSFWYCLRQDESLAAVVIEVNNTFGQRHVYLLQGEAMGYGLALQARKVFHVSPFCRVVGSYSMRFMNCSDAAGGRTLARIDHEDEAGPLLQTSVSGRLHVLTDASARAAFFAMPVLSLMLVARIHWQALRLALKRVPFFGKPPPPEKFVTR